MEDGVDLDALLPDGLGQLTRPFGTDPVDPALGALSLLRTQERVRSREPLRHPRASRTRSASPASPPGARRPTPCRCPGARRSTPRSCARMARRDRSRHALGRRAPGPGPRARRRARRPLGPRRGDHRRGPVPRRHRRHGLRPGPRVRGHRRDAQALRGLLGLARRPQPRARLDGPARARRRDPAAVRDGGPRGRRALGHARLHRHRRHPVGRRRASCSPGCCATRGASTGPSSPTTSASRSSRSCTAWPATGPRPPRRRSRRASTSSCRPSRRSASRSSRPSRPGTSTSRSSTAPCERVLRQKVELGLLDAGWDPVPEVLRDVPADCSPAGRDR